jgi:hypothetical protein
MIRSLASKSFNYENIKGMTSLSSFFIGHIGLLSTCNEDVFDGLSVSVLHLRISRNYFDLKKK